MIKLFKIDFENQEDIHINSFNRVNNTVKTETVKIIINDSTLIHNSVSSKVKARIFETSWFPVKSLSFESSSLDVEFIMSYSTNKEFPVHKSVKFLQGKVESDSDCLIDYLSPLQEFHDIMNDLIEFNKTIKD